MIDFKRFSLTFVACLSLFCVAKLCGQWWNQGEGRRMLRPGSLLTAGGPTLLLQDRFTDADGTAITAHTMDKGPGWTVPQGTWTIQSNMLNHGAGNYADCVTSDSGQANVTVSVDAIPNDTTNYECIVMRWSDFNNFWTPAIKAGSPGEFSIYEVSGGIGAQRVTASPTISTGTTYTIKA